ncbi:unnamed protein product [Ectocarpus sp. 4 AP-2014]
MGEQNLLLDILEEDVPVQDVKSWLDDAFQGVHEATNEAKSSKFKQYDALTFVVTVLNFLREDAAPLLAPSVERSLPGADHSLPASAVKESAPDVPKNERNESQQGRFPTTAFDISSADDFPALPMGEVHRGMRPANKQKRRIRPTPLSNADKPMEGDITALGAINTAASSFDKSGEVANARLTFRAQGERPSVETAEFRPSTTFKEERAEAKIVHKSSDILPGGTKPRADLAIEQHDAEGFGEDEREITNLREATSGSWLEPAHSEQRRFLEQGGAVGAPSRMSIEPLTGETKRAGRRADGARTEHSLFPESTVASNPMLSPSNGAAKTNSLLQTPTRSAKAVSISPSGGGGASRSGCARPMPPVNTPTPFATPVEKRRLPGGEQSLAILASLYVHIMIRRFVPSLATEMHLTIRLLHVHSEVTRSGGDSTLKLEQDRREDHPPSGSSAISPKEIRDDQHGTSHKPGMKIIFKTGLDCRLFAAGVLLGLKSLLPHIGTDTIDLLAGSLALASQSEELMEDLRHVLCEAKGDGVNSDGNGSRNVGQQNADDTAIVQSVGAPFAALQWREEDSIKNWRTISDRSMFQNRQESVDRFGALLRDYQGSKKGLQQYPDRALQDLSRTAASALISGLASENLGWLAQYFLDQLVGWGLASPEETDSEVMALVAPAGDKGRATLQKLHRRISTPSSGEGGNALKSSQKLRHPGTQPRQTHAKQEKGSHVVGEIRAARGGVRQPQTRKSSSGPRYGKGQAPAQITRVPTAPLQLRWFPGNQEFFYHVLLVLDSYTFNSHLKAELVAKIARLYQQLNTFKGRRKGVGNVDERGAASDTSNPAVNKGVRGFTGTMVKLKVLAKFLGLLTFSPNWGISALDSASSRHEPPLASTNEQVRLEKGIAFVLQGKFRAVLKVPTIVGCTFKTSHRSFRSPCSPQDDSCERPRFIQAWGGRCAMPMGIPETRSTQCMRMILPLLIFVGLYLGAQAQTTGCPLPLEAYLDHAWSTAGLMGAVPWMADFLRMMKWDEISPQANSYRRILGTLAKLHAQPFMQPDHPAFTESLLAVSCEVESLFQDLGSDLGVHGYRLFPPETTTVIDFDAPRDCGNQYTKLRDEQYAKLGLKPAPGSLDGEVVLSRRLIQHCCPYLEDVVTLTRNLGRAWKQGFVVGGNTTPLRAGQSPRTVGMSGISPRSRRVIKPHPLKPIRALPSLPEQIHRERSDENAGTVRESAHTESARLRLVEAFFHSLPGELQASADFVVSRSVQNACEEVLVSVVRPAVAGALRRLQVAFNQTDRLDYERPASNVAGEGLIRQHLDLQIAWTTAALGEGLASNARALAGKRGSAIAKATTLALVPRSLSLRVRQTAATIAGHHAQQAAAGKIEELMTATVLEAVSAYHSDLERAQKRQSTGGVKRRSPESPEVLASLLPRDPASDLCAIASKLCAIASKQCAIASKQCAHVDKCEGHREQRFLEAVHRVSISSSDDDIESNDPKSIIGETWYLVDAVRRCRDSSGIPETIHGTYDVSKELERTPAQRFRDHETQDPNVLETFLASLALFYRTLPDCIWRSIPNSSTLGSMSSDVVGNLVQLAARARERNARYWRKDKDPGQERCLRFPPCEPVLQLMSWGAISVVTTENVLLSCIQTATRGSTSQTGVMCPEARWHETSSSSVIAVATAVVKGYHSLALGKDLWTVFLDDLLDVTAGSVPAMDLSKPFRYHPMDLCRLIARLCRT